MLHAEMLTDWHHLSDATQLIVTRAALAKAIETVAEQAEYLATEMEQGTLQDRGGPDALRLLASVARMTAEPELETVGCA